MKKMVVFNNYLQARLYGQEAVSDQTAFNHRDLRLIHKCGDSTQLVIIQIPSDCNKYKGLSMDEIEYKSDFSFEIKTIMETRIPPHGAMLAT